MKDHASQYTNDTMESEKERLEFSSGSNRCHYTGAVFTSAHVRHPFWTVGWMRYFPLHACVLCCEADLLLTTACCCELGKIWFLKCLRKSGGEWHNLKPYYHLQVIYPYCVSVERLLKHSLTQDIQVFSFVFVRHGWLINWQSRNYLPQKPV
jgi:hypothetical protein